MAAILAPTNTTDLEMSRRCQFSFIDYGEYEILEYLALSIVAVLYQQHRRRARISIISISVGIRIYNLDWRSSSSGARGTLISRGT